MAILKTRKISFYVYEKFINEFLEFLQECGVMEPDMKKDPVSDQFLLRINEAIKNADNAIAVINKYMPAKKKLFSTRRNAWEEEYKTDKKHLQKSSEMIRELLHSEKCISDNSIAVNNAEKEIKELLPYVGLSVVPAICETAHCKAVCGKCRYNELKENSTNWSGCYEIISKNGNEAYVFFVYLKHDEAEMTEFLKKIGFSEAKLMLNITPDERIKKLKEDTNKLKKSTEICLNRIKELAKNRHMIEMYYDKMLLKIEKYKVFSASDTTEKVFIITGFMPENEADKVIKVSYEKFGAAAEYEELSDGEQAPVDFANNAFVSPVEEITSSYAMPSGNDIDPNPIMAVFYYWFFGMMFSDAGYGILMMLVCGIAGFSHLTERSKQKHMQMFFWCGISTTLWGIAYGSFFGDLIKTVSEVFGSGNVDFKPLLIDPISHALELLIISVAFGVIHVLTAMSIKFYNKWNNGERGEAIFDIGFWIIFIAAITVLSFGAGIGNNGIKNFGIFVCAVSLIGIVLTGGREKKNPVLRILFGVLSLYDITGYVGDFLSYSRLMALGLATGVIASVVNVLASLAGNSIIGAVVFVIIALVGHALNFSINMLGAYVHTNRLQYVEFYQKFYEGGGRKFKPFNMETKYYNFTKN